MSYILIDGCLISDQSYLAHHGILGQKWGVRRFQNPDGSLTSEGLKRYSKKFNKESKRAGYRKEKDLKEKTLPKGLTIYRTTTSDEKLNEGPVYVSTNKVDAKRVEGITPWIAETRGKKVSDFVTKEFTLNKDIKIAPESTVSAIRVEGHEIHKKL